MAPFPEERDQSSTRARDFYWSPAMIHHLALGGLAHHKALMESTVETFGGDADRRSWTRAVGRGLLSRCPNCGQGKLFRGYVKTKDECDSCGLDLSGHRADDAPPYITIIVVGHVLIPLALAVKQLFDPPLNLQFAIWLPAMILSAWALLPTSKGAMIGLQWANRMHGFAGPNADPDADA
ncbi:MAG: DUF983 domain-containing protein [Pseudomonadota bacterium]